MTDKAPEEKEIDTLILHLRGAGRGLCSEDPHDYMAFGFTVGDMLEAATALEEAQARIAELEAERSPTFEHLRRRGFAPGSYWCFCSRCGKQHNADKRAYRCLECAEALADRDARREALEEALVAVHTELVRIPHFDTARRAAKAVIRAIMEKDNG